MFQKIYKIKLLRGKKFENGLLLVERNYCWTYNYDYSDKPNDCDYI